MIKKIKIIAVAVFQLFFITAIALADTVTTLTNPLCGGKEKCDPPVIIGGVIQKLMGILGSIALVMFLYGGFLWLTAAGEESKITKGKDTLIWSSLGLALIFASYSFVNFIFTALTGK